MHRLTRELTLAARITKEIYRAKLIPERKLTPLWKWGAGPEAFDSGADANLATHKGSSLGHRLVSAYPFAVNRPIRIPSDTSQVLTASDVPP